MPTHTILGATGGTGSAVLRYLLCSKIPDLTINILVRSKVKLLRAFPQLLDGASGFEINVFESSISDEAALTTCVRGASVIYVCVATNNSAHKVNIAFSTAAQLITVLGQLRKDQRSEYIPPNILFNRSLSLNDEVNLPIPAFAKNVFLWILSKVYDDLKNAEVLYKMAVKDDLLACITVDGPMLMDAQGTTPTGFKLIRQGTSSWYLSYSDLGAAMVELGQRGMEFEDQAVGVSATGQVRTTFGAELWILVLGLRYKMIPF